MKYGVKDIQAAAAASTYGSLKWKYAMQNDTEAKVQKREQKEKLPIPVDLKS